MREKVQVSRREFISRSAMGIGVLPAAGGRAFGEGRRSDPAPVEVRQSRPVLDLVIDGTLFAVYNFTSSDAGPYPPFFYPVMGRNNRPITQNAEFFGSLRNHYWHRSFFVAHRKVNGISFWEERAHDCGKMVHAGFDEITSGEEGRFVEHVAWRDLKGEDLLHEVRTVGVQ